LTDFYKAARSVPGLEFLGEEEGEFPSDEDFVVIEKGAQKPQKAVPVRFYFTFPDQVALAELVSLWKRFVRGEALGHGRTEWRNVFGHLSDIRPWGPKDRVTADALADWEERLRIAPEEPVRFDVEFWYRTNPDARQRAERSFITELERLGGQVVDRSEIESIRYHAALVDVRPEVIQQVIDHPDVGLATFDEIMLLRPQSLVSGPVDIELQDIVTDTGTLQDNLGEPVVALFDGLPMALHDKLSGRLTIDDPDNFEANYGRADEQRHGTAMASLILHGDLNNPSRPPRRRLYVRPVIAPQPNDFDIRDECMPADQLGVDLIWRAFRRMFEEENGNPPAAPSVRIVNLSLGDSKRRFAGIMSPWARLLDALAWQYGLLILVSAGNIRDEFAMPSALTWSSIESASPETRQNDVLSSIVTQRSTRKLLSPAEAINVLTIGACHSDNVVPNGSGLMAIDPYTSPCLPNPSSALGLGFRRSVKPDLLMPGGREHVRSQTSHAPINLRPVDKPGRAFGIGVACPGLRGETDRKINSSGTSEATALATNAAMRILEAIEEIPDDPAYPQVDPNFHAVIPASWRKHTKQ
jgi:hypothetical protein